MGKPKPPADRSGNGDAWTWIAAWVLSIVCALGAGINWGERDKVKELRERDEKWKALLDQEREQNIQLKSWAEKMQKLEDKNEYQR